MTQETQSPDVVEKVARAIFRAHFHPDDSDEIVQKKWDGEWPDDKRRAYTFARAALAAIPGGTCPACGNAVASAPSYCTSCLTALSPPRPPPRPASGERMMADWTDEAIKKRATAIALDLGYGTGAIIKVSLRGTYDYDHPDNDKHNPPRKPKFKVARVEVGPHPRIIGIDYE